MIQLRQILRAGAVLAAAMMLSGCAVLSAASSEAPSIFVLTPAEPAIDSDNAPLQAQLVVAEPLAPAAYDTHRIVYLPTPNEVNYFADARWTDRAPRMVQALVVASLDNAEKFLAVGRKGAGLAPDYEMRLDMRAFGVEEGGESAGKRVHIQINARLVDYRRDRIMATRTFEVSEPTAETAIAGLVKEFDGSLSAIMVEMAGWAHAEISRHKAAGEEDGVS